MGGQQTPVLLPENELGQGTGQFKFQGEVGSAECQVVSNTILEAGTTTGQAQFDVDNGGAANDEEKCSVGGGLLSLGCTDVEQVTVAGAFVKHAVETKTIDITTGTIQTHLTGGVFCPKTVQLTPGTLHLQFTQEWFHTYHLSGTLQAHLPSVTVQVQISGEGTITPAHKYGIK